MYHTSAYRSTAHSVSLCRRSRGVAFTVRAGWNDFEWSKAKIVQHEKAAEGVSLGCAVLVAHRTNA